MTRLPDPQMRPDAYATFGIRAPRSTHFRKATCVEVDCPEWRYGWKLRWDVMGEQDRYLLTHCGRKYTVDQEWIVFEAGQPCFRESKHQTRLERPEIFLRKNVHMSVRGQGRIVHKNPEDWADDFMNTTQAAVEEIERG